MPLLLFLLLLLIAGTSNATPLNVRLQLAAENAEKVSNELLSQPTKSLSTADWLVLTEAQLRLRNKDAAMDAVNNALLHPADNYLHAYAFLLKAQVYGILFRDTAIAVTQLEQAEMLLSNTEDPSSIVLYSDVLQNFAQAYNQLGNIPRAIQYAEHSLTLALRQQQSEAELKARITLGRLTLQNNNYSQAFVHLNTALQLAQRLNDADAIASLHMRLGMAYRKIEYYNQALEHLLQAKQRYYELNRLSSYTNTLIYLGETYLENANTAVQAEQYLAEAITTARQIDDLPRVGVATMALGRMAALQGNTPLAIQYLNDAVQLFRQQSFQTYLQEAQLELAELLRKQGSPTAQIDALLNELHPQITSAAGYLQQRFYDTAAHHAATQQHWQDAFEYLKQAMALRFDEQKAQNKFQLDLIDMGLTQEAHSHELQAELNTQHQRTLRLQRDVYSLLLVIVLLLIMLGGVFIWFRRQHRKKNCISALASGNWQRFCLAIQQAEPSANYILAFKPAFTDELKQVFGEQPLVEMWYQALQQINPTLKARFWDGDILWLGLASNTDSITQTNQQIFTGLQRQLQQRFVNQQWFNVIFPLGKLRQKAWSSVELTALREAFWLMAVLCHDHDSPSTLTTAVLDANHPDSCEWRPSMIRQDLLNAIRLGNLTVDINGARMTDAQVDGKY